MLPNHFPNKFLQLKLGCNGRAPGATRVPNFGAGGSPNPLDTPLYGVFFILGLGLM